MLERVKARKVEGRKTYPFLTFVTTDPLKTVIGFLRVCSIDLDAVIAILLLFIGCRAMLTQ